MTSFENTKSEIVGSALGKAIGLSTSSTWNDVVTKIKSVADRGTDQTTNSIGWGSGYFALNSIPEGYYRSSGYSWAPEIRTNRSNFGTASAGNVLSGVTFTSQNGIRISGTMKNYTNSIQTATTDATDSSKSCYWARNGYIDVIPAVGYWGSWNWDRSYIRVPDRYNDGYNAGVNAKTSKSWTGHINTTSGGSFTTGFQPNVILLKRDGDNFPIGVYCSYGISVNHIEGPSNSHLSNIFSTNSNGFSLGTLNAYTKDKYCYCAAFKIV
ncbi:MAG TPA: hypothetical protein DCW90_00290 [Lachnospiraceae bacterium]|nr:hypothetical protein [Lachnospiraceae bacterium]